MYTPVMRSRDSAVPQSPRRYVIWKATVHNGRMKVLQSFHSLKEISINDKKWVYIVYLSNLLYIFRVSINRYVLQLCFLTHTWCIFNKVHMTECSSTPLFVISKLHSLKGWNFKFPKRRMGIKSGMSNPPNNFSIFSISLKWSNRFSVFLNSRE